MELAAPLHQERGIGHVLGEGVLEHVGQLGEEPALVDQLERGQLAQEPVGPLADLGEAVDEAAREFATDDRGELERALGGLGQTVDPRGDDVLDRARNGDLAHGPGELVARPHPSQRPTLFQRLDQLLDVERIALRLAADQPAQRVGQGVGGQHGGHHACAVLG